MHICISKLTIIGSDNGLSPGRREAIIWINAGILLIGPNFSEILISIQTFSFKKNAFENVICEMASILSRPQWVNQSFTPLCLHHVVNPYIKLAPQYPEVKRWNGAIKNERSNLNIIQWCIKQHNRQRKETIRMLMWRNKRLFKRQYSFKGIHENDDPSKHWNTDYIMNTW